MPVRPEPDPCWAAWRQAAGRSEIDTALRDLYRRIDAAITQKSPTCWQSGKCCHFDTYGHLLYVTGLEIAWFRSHAPLTPPSSPPPTATSPPPDTHTLPILTPRNTAPTAEDAPAAQGKRPEVSGDEGEGKGRYEAETRGGEGGEGGCVYQVDHLCTAHMIRPLGCRVFFCQDGTQDWQNVLYEKFLDELRQMHTRWGLDYRYMEWRAGLKEAAAAQTGDG